MNNAHITYEITKKTFNDDGHEISCEVVQTFDAADNDAALEEVLQNIRGHKHYVI